MDLDDILASARESKRERNIDNLVDEIEMDEELNALADPRFFGPDFDDEYA
jgi:hypothetical protein